MALVQSTLASQLANLAPTAVEAEAIANLSAAWDAYFAGASVAGVPITPGSYAAALTSFQGALVGMSAPNAGALKIQSAVTAFWSTLAPLGPSLWVLAPNVITPPLTPPPTISAIAVALEAVFASNASNPNITLPQSVDAIAGVLHTNGGLGGIAIVQPPPVAPPVPTPIL